MASKDASFAEYVNRHKVSTSEWQALTEDKRAQFLRKPSPVIFLRNYYLKQANSRVIKKSRKAHVLFTGYPQLFVATDGNPRVLKSVITELLESGILNHDKITATAQERILNRAASAFKSSLGIAIAPQPDIGSWGVGMVALLDSIANYFHKRLYGPVFDSDPQSTFEVDEKVSADVISTLRVALNLGGIIQVDMKDDDSIGDLRGRRFRLCYLLALLARLPFRLGPEARLSEIIANPKIPAPKELSFDF